ncbi:actin-like ATPase domain-containing protein [Wilcoxina mikolae CBS 423.85]|nr:actin-like ATPase domain-containing protein [Wilcoxina mikolae CBS 423.85]
MGPTNPTKHRFVVGVDFGTTFVSCRSDYFFALLTISVKLVQTWPNGGTGNSSADQVPTEIRYTDPLTRDKKWGYEVSRPAHADTLRWFKMLLQDKSRPAVQQEGAVLRDAVWRTSEKSTAAGNMSSPLEFTPPATTPAQQATQILQELDMSPVTVVSDFLKSVLEITTASIERTYDARFVCDSTVEYVLTIPAIWSDSAKALMVQAAESAGFGSHRDDFNLVSEPESAAAYTLVQSNNLKASLHKGDTFIICDAGGGTVDLVSYKITDLEPLKLDESVGGTGALCGSVFLDYAFEQYIRRLLGDKAINDMKPRSKHEMMRTWEEKVKFTFGNTTDPEAVYEVNVPGVPDNDDTNIEDGFHFMTSDDVQKIFDPVVDRIIHLVEQQVLEVQQKGETVAAILLVGGFGSSEYLLKRLQETRYGPASTELQVVQPINARSAIARGALLRGLDGSIVKQRRSRRCYGSRSSVARPKEDAKYWNSTTNTWNHSYSSMGDHIFWDPQTDTSRVSGHLNWYIVKDMIVGNIEPVMIDFFRSIPIPAAPRDFIFHTPLFACDLMDPPDFKWKNPKAIYRVCTLFSDLSHIPLSKFKKTTNARGESFYEVKYVLRVTLLDEVLKFDRLVDGEVCGEITAKFL